MMSICSDAIAMYNSMAQFHWTNVCRPPIFEQPSILYFDVVESLIEKWKTLNLILYGQKSNDSHHCLHSLQCQTRITMRVLVWQMNSHSSFPTWWNWNLQVNQNFNISWDDFPETHIRQHHCCFDFRNSIDQAYLLCSRRVLTGNLLINRRQTR